MQRPPPPYRRPPPPYEPYYGDNVYLHPLARQPARRRPLGFGSGLLLYGACAAVAVYLMWPTVKQGLDDMAGRPRPALQINIPNVQPQQRPSRGDDDLSAVGRRNHNGVTPWDKFGWHQGERGDRRGDNRVDGRTVGMSLDPDEVDHDVEDRRRGGGVTPPQRPTRDLGRDLGPAPAPDREPPVSRRYGELPVRHPAERGRVQVRECGGTWWWPGSDPGCGAWQDGGR
jgi:hypothetical protein